MAKSYTEDLAAWVKKREKSRPRQDKGVVAFIAVKDDVADAIAAGYALKTIWEHMHETGKIPYRYETFLKHVKKHITQKKISSKASAPPKRSPQPSVAPTNPEEPRKLQRTINEFEFNSEPKKEDLI